MIVKVLVDTNVKTLNKVYDYLVPENLESMIDIGKRVRINFGKGKGTDLIGIVVKIENEVENNSKKLKAIVDVIDNKSYLNIQRLKLAKWIAKMYFCNVYTAIKLFFPSMTESSMKKKELVGKTVSIVKLKLNKEDIEKDIENGKIKSARHIKLIRCLEENEYIYIDDAIDNLGISRSIINTVKNNGYIEILKKDVDIEDYSNIQKTEKLEPTEEQKYVIDSLKQKINENKFNVSLLYGVTGSGKTEVYLQLMEECIKNNKTAIVLVPEISLTYQTKIRFISRFGDIVSVLHSKMTVLEKETEYKKIIEGKAKIVIGPRSALFVPFDNLGLIIIDEEHDPSYISQNPPKYSTKEVASKIAYDNHAALLLGSATPEIATMYKAKSGKIDLYKLTNRPKNYKLPKVEIVDMKEEILIGGSFLISNKLKENIEKNIRNKEQTFIFLNRRGHSTYIMCSDCGHILKCPNCDVTLTYHNKQNLLLCHYCSYAEKLSNKCSKCGSSKLNISGSGTEKVEEELKRIFPEASILRMDMDTTIKKGSHEEILNSFKNNRIDILVGTQMISKGHDIANVTLVGIINADSTFTRDDVLSSERAFANLLQVSGRAGRGEKEGRVIVQAYDTDSYILDAIKAQSYDMLYEKEIDYRKILKFPPFTDVIVMELTSKNKNSITTESAKLYDILSKYHDNKYIVYSPKAPYVSRINNKYRIQILIKTKINDKILDLLYENLSKYDKIKRRDVNLTVAKNPNFIG